MSKRTAKIDYYIHRQFKYPDNLDHLVFITNSRPIYITNFKAYGIKNVKYIAYVFRNIHV